MVSAAQSAIIEKAFSLLSELPVLAVDGEKIFPIVAAAETRKSPSTLAWLRSIREAPDQAYGEVVRKVKADSDDEEEVLTQPAALYDVEVALVPEGPDYAALLRSQGALLRVLRDNPKLGLEPWFGMEGSGIGMALAGQDDALRAEAARIVGDIHAGLCLSIRITLGIESASFKKFRRIEKRKITAERMPSQKQ